jgi:hypothetical protein
MRWAACAAPREIAGGLAPGHHLFGIGRVS